MTCREKLAKEHSDCIRKNCEGGCVGCPHNFEYLDPPSLDECLSMDCAECWDREIPGTEKPKMDIPWDKVHEMIEEGMRKRDREFHIYFNPDTGMTVNIYPWREEEA